MAAVIERHHELGRMLIQQAKCPSRCSRGCADMNINKRLRLHHAASMALVPTDADDAYAMTGHEKGPPIRRAFYRASVA